MYQSSTDHALALRFWLLVEVNSELFECHDQIRINIPIKWNEETYPKTPCSNKAIHLWVALLAFFSFYCAGWESNYQTAEASVSTNGNEWCIEVQFLTNFFSTWEFCREKDWLWLLSLLASPWLLKAARASMRVCMQRAQEWYLQWQKTVKYLY